MVRMAVVVVATGVVTNGTGAAGAYTRITVAPGAPTLYYYCSVHSGMGGQANTNSTAGASNFDGSIQSTVRANASAGFSIVTFTGSGAGSFGHGLNADPAFVITKKTAATGSWNIYHKSLGVNQYLSFSTSAAGSSTGFWSGTNSSVVGFSASNNSSVGDNVAYCFSEVSSYSSYGSYIGTASNDGRFVFTGFRPRWVMIKASSNSGTHWIIIDTARDSYNQTVNQLYANLANAEGSGSAIDSLSNGFKIRDDSYNNINGSGILHLRRFWRSLQNRPCAVTFFIATTVMFIVSGKTINTIALGLIQTLAFNTSELVATDNVGRKTSCRFKRGITICRTAL